MPSRKELRETLTSITHESYASGVPLNKTSYKDAEANQIQLQALISYHELMFVDELLSKLNASTTNINIKTYRSYMRDLYSANKMYHTRYNRELAISISKFLEAKTSLGRNQAIELLLGTAKDLLNA